MHKHDILAFPGWRVEKESEKVSDMVHPLELLMGKVYENYQMYLQSDLGAHAKIV